MLSLSEKAKRRAPVPVREPFKEVSVGCWWVNAGDMIEQLFCSIKSSSRGPSIRRLAPATCWGALCPEHGSLG